MKDFIGSVDEYNIKESIPGYLHVTVLTSPCLCERVLVSEVTTTHLNPIVTVSSSLWTSLVDDT